MFGRRRNFLIVGVVALAAMVVMQIASHGGASAARAAETVEPPRLVTAPAENIRFTQAELVGSVNPHGSPTTFYFAWGTSYTSLTNKTPVRSAGKGTRSETFRNTISGLEQGREYFFQLVATNAGGTSKGSIGHFVTLKDTTAPVIELSGPLTEGLKPGTTEYALHVHATDGTSAHLESGVRSISIAVDGNVVDSVEQPCPKGNCTENLDWTYVQEATDHGTHEVLVSVKDQVGNEGSQSMKLVSPNGAYAPCSPLGGTSVGTPTKVETMPGGGTASYYEEEDGSLNEYPSQPAGFNPLTASKEALLENGFPPRPSQAGRIAQWEYLVTHMGAAAPAGGCMVQGSAPIPAPSPGGEARNVPNQSGFQAASGPARPNLFVASRAEWKLPGVAGKKPQCPSPGNRSFSSWVALGGGNQGFFQAGTSFQRLEEGGEPEPVAFADKFRAGHTGPLLPSEEEVVLGLPVEVGNNIYSEVRWLPQAERAMMLVVNTSKERHVTEYSKKGHPAFYNGTYADFIAAERNTNQEKNRPEELLNFGSIGFHEAATETTGGNWLNLRAVPEIFKLRMQRENETGNIMAVPSALGEDGESFTDTWKACLP
jgi:hypothetical protein